MAHKWEEASAESCWRHVLSKQKEGFFTCCVGTPGSSLPWDAGVGVECFHQPKGRLGKFMKSKFIKGYLNAQRMDSPQGVPKLRIVEGWEGA